LQTLLNVVPEIQHWPSGNDMGQDEGFSGGGKGGEGKGGGGAHVHEIPLVQLVLGLGSGHW